MSRFFKSAAFPILIVVVLAFFAQKLISPGDGKKDPNYSEFLTQVDRGQVKDVTLNTKNNKIDVELKPGAGAEKRKYQTAYPDNTEQNLVNTLRAENVPIDVKAKSGSGWLTALTYILPFVIFLLFWLFIINQMQGGGSKVMSFGKSRAKRMAVDAPKITFRDVAGRGRGGRGAARDQGVPREPQEVPGAGRADPQGRAALRPAGHRQDAAGARRRRRGRRAVLLDLGLGLRRDVRGRRRLARARPLRAGQAEQPLHHLHGRDRRRRAPPRRRPGRRPRRARADAQPAAGRDGRLHDDRQHHPDRGHQPARHPRPRAAAPGPLRPPDRGRPPRPQGPRQDPRGPHARQAAGQGDRPRQPGRPDPGLHRRRPPEPGERGRAAGRPPGQARDRPHPARGGDHARDRRPREEDARDEREGAPHHRLPRDGPRDRRPLPREHRPGAQDLRDLARAGARATRSRCPPRTSSSPRARSCRTRWP